MFGWTILLLLVTLASGSSIARSLFAKLEETRRAHISNCTDDNNSVTVNCQASIRESNHTMCCSFGLLNSSHLRRPCVTSTTAPPFRSECASYELSSCVGHSVRLTCAASLRCSDRGVSWLRDGRALVAEGRELRLVRLRRDDAGDYTCYVTDEQGRRAVRARVALTVQFPPELSVPNQTGDRLECVSEANPSPRIRWLRDGEPLLSEEEVSSESALCTTSSRLRLIGSGDGPHNYTCVAENVHGEAAVSLYLLTQATEDDDDEDVTSAEEAPGGKRRFNVTGFIVGMLPPLFISFYIILKLGYRSRYAEERPEDDGFREEPFFISY